MVGANPILHLHNGLYHIWSKYEGTAVIGSDTLGHSPFWLYKPAAQLCKQLGDTLLAPHSLITSGPNKGFLSSGLAHFCSAYHKEKEKQRQWLQEEVCQATGQQEGGQAEQPWRH
jgi:hypothetical protein